MSQQKTQILGYATEEGTGRFRARFSGAFDPQFFNKKQGLYLSSIGIGSYLGDCDEKTDDLYQSALSAAVRAGINVIDTAINYRAQRSERCFGQALQDLIASGNVARDELVLCTKGGFIPFDKDFPENPRTYFRENYIEPGILKEGDISQGCHSIAPTYLEDQLTKSLKNLGVETIDIYYLHNPETQLADVDRGEFLERMRLAIAWLEEKVKEGKIRMYGTATWNGYRVMPEAQDFLSLAELMVLAREVAGTDNHFKAIQLPVNLAMPEAWIIANQSFGANQMPMLALVQKSDLIAIGSGSLLQARLTGKLPESLDAYFEGVKNSAQKALQFARSVPGLTTALVGMKNTDHVCENMELAKIPLIDETQLVLMFQGKN